MKCETYVLQNKAELRKLIDLFKSENVKAYLEIGSKFGGSLWQIGNSLPKGSRIVAVDLPHGDNSFKENEHGLRQCAHELSNRGYDMHLFIGDSTDQPVIDSVKALGPFDAVFIDANHTIPYITKDWQNYGPLGRIVAFHDINFFRPGGLPPHKKPIEVPQFWSEIKNGYRHTEIILSVPDHVGCRDNGIGVLWPTAST